MGLAGMGKGIASRYATGRGIAGWPKRLYARKEYKRPVVERTGEGFKTRKVYEDVGGPFGPASIARQTKMETMPQGQFYQGPMGMTKALAKTGAVAGGLGLAAAPFLPEKGEESIEPRPLVREVPWSAPEDMMTYAEGVEASAKKKDAMLKDMIKYSVLISALGQGGGKELMEQMMDVMDAELEGEEDVRFAKAVQAVYGGGNPPQNAREAYERLAPIVGPEHAATLSGHQLGFDPKRTAEERLRVEIMDALQTQGREAAIQVLIKAWTADDRKAPDLVDPSNWPEAAGQMIDQLQSAGGSALIHSVEDD